MSGPTRRPTPAGAATEGGAAAATSPARSWGKARAPPRIPPLRNSSRREIPSQLMASPPGLFVEERIITVRARERPATAPRRQPPGVTEFTRRGGSQGDDSPARRGEGHHACRLQAPPRRRHDPRRGRGGPPHVAPGRPGDGAARRLSSLAPTERGGGAGSGRRRRRGPARGRGPTAGADSARAATAHAAAGPAGGRTGGRRTTRGADTARSRAAGGDAGIPAARGGDRPPRSRRGAPLHGPSP